VASGAVVGIVLAEMPPATLMPQLATRTGGSTPAERILVYSFDAATIEYMDFLVYLSGYAGGGLTCTLGWSATSATTNVTRWEIAFRRMADDAEDVDTSQTYDYNAVDATTANVSGEIAYDTIAFTSGADMDSWANNEYAIMRVSRNAAHANDTMAGDAELWGAPIVKET
jgi:hypothetical protein